ncbi:MAG: hypothetical protein DCC68_07250 [Planctomycetota bacterium]|nr:MAG: hypothetical protein DCC68_07250 [Planctomycetota bacterium]
MEIPILVEPLPERGFRAVMGEPLHLETEASTREEAVAKLRELVDQRIAAGAQVVALPIEPDKHPLARFVGMLKDDPLVEPWKQAMQEYRDAHDDEATDS